MTFFFLFLPGCATVASSLNPQFTADQIAGKNRFYKERVPAQTFTLTTYSRLENPRKSITIYIEGDGRAWLSKNRLSDDPTPFHPMVLELASLDPSPNVAYLARPCQYDNSALQAPCAPEYWSSKRFSEEVIASMNTVLDVLVKRVNASEVHLVGYSGGGAIAVLIAARRTDISSLRTIAGNLDITANSDYHGVSPLKESLNPKESAMQVARIPQVHFIGTRDEIMPPFISENFALASQNSRCVKIIPVQGATHHNGWVEKWKELVTISASCEASG